MKAYLLKDPTTNLEFISSNRNEVAGYEHAQTEVHDGHFLTTQELEAKIRKAVEITRLDGGVNFQGDMTSEMSVDEIVSTILGEGE